MTKDEKRAHLATLLRSAYMLGCAQATYFDPEDHLEDLVNLAMVAVNAGPLYGFGVNIDPMSGLWRSTGPMPAKPSPFTPLVKSTDDQQLETQKCGFSAADDGDPFHVHDCDKAPGHADGPHGSDHQCTWCGQLYASPGDAGTVDERTPAELREQLRDTTLPDEEIEL